MRLVTLNAWGMRGSWAARLPVFRRGFGALDADIVTLQETIFTNSTDQAADMLGPGYHLAQQRDREADGQGITTASRWPFGQVFEIDFHLTDHTRDFACTCLVTEVLAPEPLGRIWVANHFPDYQPDHERERCMQSLAAARRLESLIAESPGHVIVAGDMDADADADSMRFWTGRHVIEDMSVCYRNAWEANPPRRAPRYLHSGEPESVELRLAVSWHRSRSRPLWRFRRSHAVDPRLPPRIPPRPHQRQRPLRPPRRT
jgi:exonuclease III